MELSLTIRFMTKITGMKNVVFVHFSKQRLPNLTMKLVLLWLLAFSWVNNIDSLDVRIILHSFSLTKIVT